MHLKNVFRKLNSLLIHPLSRHIDIDSPEISIIRREIIRSKPFLKRLYQEWYRMIADHLPRDVSGPVLELGSGAGFLSDYVPDLIASDIFKFPGLDVVLNAESLPFFESSLKGIVMVDVCHHIPKAESFFENASCCLKPGGVIIMIEPWVSRWSQIIYRYLHHEPFDMNAKNWSFPKQGPMSGANSALPWIIFDRDRNRFELEFNRFYIKTIHLHTPFRYLVSGGVSMKNLMPECFFDFWTGIEKNLRWSIDSWAMFALIVLEYRPTQSQKGN